MRTMQHEGVPCAKAVGLALFLLVASFAAAGDAWQTDFRNGVPTWMSQVYGSWSVGPGFTGSNTLNTSTFHAVIQLVEIPSDDMAIDVDFVVADGAHGDFAVWMNATGPYSWRAATGYEIGIYPAGSDNPTDGIHNWNGVLTSRSNTIHANEAHHLRVERQGDDIRVFLDNGTATYMQCTNDMYHGGDIGVRVSGGGAIDNVTAAPVNASVWNQPSGGSWGTAVNWTRCVPDAVGADVHFLGRITAPRQVSVEGTRTVGSLTFDSENSYTLSGGALSLEAPWPSITVKQGTHTIASPINLAQVTTITTADNTMLKLSGGVTGNDVVAKEGAGMLLLTGNMTGLVGHIAACEGVIAGNASIGGSLTIQSGASVSPSGSDGTAIGSLTVFGGLTLNKGAVYSWELNEYADDAPGINHDFIQQAGANKELVCHGGTLDLNFLNGTAPNPSVGFWQEEHTWTLVDNHGRLPGGAGMIAPTVGNTPWTAAGTFATAFGGDEGKDLVLNWNPVEPVPGSVRSTGAKALHEEGIVGTGVKVGIVESIGDPPDLRYKPWNMHPALMGGNVDGTPTSQLASDHATHVAGIIVGDDSGAIIDTIGRPFRGMAPGATITTAGCLSPVSIDDKVAHLARDEDVHIRNVSMGGITGVDNEEVAVCRNIDAIVDTEKVSIVVAAGNDPEHSVIAFPAEAYNVVAVGPLYFSDSPIDGPWPTTHDRNVPGPTAGQYFPGRSKPDLVAPGGVYAPNNDNGNLYTFTGTGSSFAAPHVTGAVALLTEAAQKRDGETDLDFVENDWRKRVDPRVIKSVLLTGADKSVTGWSTLGDATSNPRTWKQDGQRKLADKSYVPVSYDATTPLDYELGAGALDVLEAKKVLLGETDDGLGRATVFGALTSAGPHQTGLSVPEQGMSLVATLVWNAYVNGEDVALSNLDLYLYGGPVYGLSTSTVDNVEHLFVTDLARGDYELWTVLVDSFVRPEQEEVFALSYRLMRGNYGLSGGQARVVREEDGFDTRGYQTQGMPSGSKAVGDVYDLEDVELDSGRDFATLKVAYDEADLPDLDIVESTLLLYWFDEENGRWLVAGNASNIALMPETDNPEACFHLGAPTDTIGDWGVNMAEDYVWANVVHASTYAAAGVPEPATLSMLIVGSLALLRRRRR